MRWRAAQLAGVQLIYFLRLLILARLLAPDAFGLLAIATIAVSVLMRLSDVGMIPALVQRPDATVGQYDAAWTVGLARAVFIALALVLAAPLIAHLFGEPHSTGIIQALALRPFIESMASIGTAQLSRELKFRQLALIQVPGAVVDLVVAVATAPTLGVWALVAGTLAGTFTSAVVSYVFAPHRPKLSFHWGEIVPLVRYGRWVLATSIVALAGTLVTQLAVSRTLGAAALGLYFLALKVAFLPIEAASSVVGAVAFPMFASLHDDARASTRAFATMLTGLCLVLVPGYALVFVLAPLLEQTLGGRWAGTAQIVQILAVAGITAILGELLVPLLMGRGRADRALVLEVLQTGVLLLVLLPCLILLQVHGAAVAWLIGNASTMVLGVVWARRMVPGALHGARPRLAAAAVTAVVAAAAAGLVSTPLTGAVGLVAGGVAGVTAGALALWWMNARFGLRLEEFLGLLLAGGRDTDERGS
jgi:O-antigen/teichoic acid export membrane protein